MDWLKERKSLFASRKLRAKYHFLNNLECYVSLNPEEFFNLIKLSLEFFKDGTQMIDKKVFNHRHYTLKPLKFNWFPQY